MVPCSWQHDGPITLASDNTLYKLLTNPYYAGVIRYKGALHPGAHEPLIEPALFDQVQSLLKARNAQATRHVQHAHHLKGLLHCVLADMPTSL